MSSYSDTEFRMRVTEKLKEDIYKAQRMYFLAQKLGDRIPGPFVRFSMEVLNRYIKMAKEINLKLSPQELYDRLFRD